MNRRKLKCGLEFGANLAILSSFLCSQLFFAEIFLFRSGLPYKTGNVAKADSGAVWYNSGYSYRKEVVLSREMVANTDQSDFPVLFSVTDPHLRSLVNGGRVENSAGYDIIFVSQDGSKLDHEIEQYDASSGKIVAWIRIPLLSVSFDTVFYMYYGNPNIAVSQENKSSLWNESGRNNFKIVQHMDENPGGSAPQMLDSTQNANHGTSYGNMGGYGLVAGTVGGALSFDGSNDFISLPQGALKDKNSGTISAWVKTSDTSGSIISQYSMSGSYGYMLNVDSGMIKSCFGTTADPCFSTNDFDVAYDVNINNNIWHYVSVTYDGSSVVLYVNGIERSRADKTGNISYHTTYGNIIGSQGYIFNGVLNTQGNGYLSGIVDEVRIADVTRNADWVRTEFNNQYDPGGFYDLGVEESVSPKRLYDWQYRKAITIDSGKVSDELHNFPILVSLQEDAGLAAEAREDGEDILFTLSSAQWNLDNENDKLAHEIEYYDPGTGNLQAWVKIPRLSSSADTVIYMYYGNSSTRSQQNRISVWGRNMRLVQHMNEDPSGAAPQMKDSAHYAHDGTSYGAMLGGDLIEGKIDGALNFDGINDYIDCTAGHGFNITGSVTASAWIKMTDSVSAQYIVSKRTYSIRIHPNRSVQFETRRADDTNFDSVYALGSYPLVPGEWYYLTAVYDVAAGNKIVYINGTPGTPINKLDGALPINAAVRLNIGKYASGSFFSFSPIDEVRVSSIARSSAWITTEYNNQSSPQTFMSIGSEESLMHHFKISGSASQIAGSVQPLTLTAVDVFGENDLNYSGDRMITLFGADSISDFIPTFTDKDGNLVPFGSPALITFINGIAATDVVLYKAESVHIDATDGIFSTSDDYSYGLNVSVVPGALSSFDIYYPSLIVSETPLDLAITSLDNYSNITASVIDTTFLSVSSGLLNSSSIIADLFTDDGEAVINITISKIYQDKDVVLTVQNGGVSNSRNLSVAGFSQGSVFLPPPKPAVTLPDLISGTLPQGIIQIAISQTPDFKDSIFQEIDYQKLKDIPQTNTTLYLKFRTKEGGVSDVLTIHPNTLLEGDIVKTPHHHDVFIIKYQNGKRYKRLILSPSVFNSYQHLLWTNIKTISQDTLDTYTTSNLVQVKGDNNIYELTPEGDTGKRRIINIHAEEIDKDNIYEINKVDRDSYASS